jgi:broad specificity phosphatase PhoE
VTILLVRHARAGRRDRWVGDDRLRPLSKKGRVQAEALSPKLRELVGAQVLTLRSSPWVRCVQTLEPLASALGTEIQSEDALGEGMGAKAVEVLGSWTRHGPAALCTHGDVIEAILGHLTKSGVRLGGRLQAAKGSVWVLGVNDGAIVSARYVPPPA